MVLLVKKTVVEKTFELYINEKRHTSDLEIYECGWEKCNSNHDFSSNGRDYFLLHYIAKGQGVFQIGNVNYPLKEKTFFLIFPNEKHRYFANSDDPYEYYWIGFHGLEANTIIKESLLEKQYVFSVDRHEDILKIFRDIRKVDKNTYASKYSLLSYFYKLFAIIIDERNINTNFKESSSKDFVGNVMKYIQVHYNEGITVSSIADVFHVNRSHLFRVFKKQMGISLEQYILDTRLTNALILLKNNLLSIKEVANIVGFKDYNNFLKIFKRKYHVTPSEYRKDPFETEHI